MNISKNSILKADFRIEFSKYASIILNFLNVIAFSFLYGEGALIDYVFYISLSIILNAIFDQGLNTLNCDMQLKKNIFYSYEKQYSLKFISFILLLIATLFVLFDDSYLILIACLWAPIITSFEGGVYIFINQFWGFMQSGVVAAFFC